MRINLIILSTLFKVSTRSFMSLNVTHFAFCPTSCSVSLFVHFYGHVLQSNDHKLLHFCYGDVSDQQFLRLMEYLEVYTYIDFKLYLSCRSSHSELFLGNVIQKICIKFTGAHPCRSAATLFKLHVDMGVLL